MKFQIQTQTEILNRSISAQAPVNARIYILNQLIYAVAHENPPI